MGIVFMAKKVLEVTASSLVRSSMEAYAKEVIEDRSLPDFRDGLKISQRRILYYMWSEGLVANGNFKASANIVGGVLGKLHAHGDMSCYTTLVNLNSNTVSPVDGDGAGWGDIHTEASAMRYTKTKLSEFGERFCRDIPISEWIPTYSGDWNEPIIIPAPLPYALLAGTSGIAVAVATSIPGHNLTELVKTFIKVLHGEQDIDKLVGPILLSPESKTGGVVVSTLDEIRDVYRKGKGKIRWRCDYEVTYDKKDNEWSLIVTAIPESFPLASWLAKMKSHAQMGMLQIENESCAGDPIRFVITFDNVAFFYDVIEPSLYCTDSYSFNLIAKAGERAVDISLQHHSLLSWIDAWLTWREDIEIKIVKSQIESLEKDLHREMTKFWASENIDAIIATLKTSQHPIKDLKAKFKLDESQAKIIAEMQLQSISKLSKDKQEKAIGGLKSEIAAENKKLSQPKLLIENTLRSLLKFDTKGRLAKIDYGDSEGEKAKKALKKSDGKPNYWAIETSKPKLLHQIGSELSLRKRIFNPYLGIVNAQTGILTVTEKGEVRRWNVSELMEKDIGYSYIGILSPDYQQLCISLNNGLWGNYAMEQKVANWTTKLIHSGSDRVLSAVGLNKGDMLWVYSPTHLEAVACDWAPFSRSHKNGWKAKGGKEIKLLAIPKGYSLAIDTGNGGLAVGNFVDLIRPSTGMISQFLKAKFYYLFNPKDKRQMLCLAQDGTRSLLSGEEISSVSLDLIQTYLI
jgi:DNA gyrase/topoisomerase IV subunit A